METFSNLYGIFGQNNEHNYANENENHLPEFLQSVNNGSSSLSEFNLENEEFGLNSETRLLVARLLVAPLLVARLLVAPLLGTFSTGIATTFAGYYQLK